ncbi:1-phosphofructokinase family hexose kinase [Nocardia huaxiensis]|uniref:1-phosphofructokinase family hexose kinase n=1 Tax=Nocardia huaxiensis TaxID=2755382 RepID=A0A7D6ZEV0_9NOCA|nr:1-phosphofructokinase family hexose kinase [Nocardia huaxiensis]QLY28567.1 1-phosphofructokinase family hexose kinase [Nocardia huaxiensis]
MAIVTLTMNPAIDLATEVDQVWPTDKMRCAPPRFDPGGGGINVARTVAALGAEVTAVFPAGGPAGVLLEDLLRCTGVPTRPVPVASQTRQNLAVTEHNGGGQYRFVFPGARLTVPEQHRCLAEVERTAAGCEYIVASGSLPPGVPVDFYQTLADMAAELGPRLVLDTSGAALRAVRGGVYLLKPSVRELADYVGHPLPAPADRVTAARRLLDAGVSEIVVVSLGAQGAVAVHAEGTQYFDPIEVTVRSGIGAGDAMVGGMTVGLTRGLSLADAVRLGIASATAALGTSGTRPGHPARIEELFRELTAAAPAH